MYDALVRFWSKVPVPRGEYTHLFLRDRCSQPNRFQLPQIYGWRIQDLRWPGLERREAEARGDAAGAGRGAAEEVC